MGKIKGFFANIYDWLTKQAEKSDLDFKFNSSGKLPKLSALQESHFNLISGYVNALSGVSRLSAFINTYEVYKSNQRPSPYRFALYLIFKFSPYRLSSVKALVKILVESHIKEKLKELEIIYTQLSATVPREKKNREKYLDWLKSAKHECRELSDTLIYWDIIKSFSLAILNFLVVTGVFAGLVRIFSTPYSLAWLFVVLIFFSIFFFSFIDNSYQAKRDIFSGSGNDESRNIYSLENNLFELLGRGKKVEWPIDYLASALIFFPFLIVLKLTLHIDNLYIYLVLTIIYLVAVWVYTQKRYKSKLI